MAKVGTSTTGTSGLGTLAAPTGPLVVAPPPAPDPNVPQAPEYVIPFPSADDMLAVNDWLTNWQMQMEDIDYGISQQRLDTTTAKAANDKQALEQRSAADDAMAARGLFGSSLAAAATYDIEATRSLANTYLDSKLNEAITAGATRKGLLSTAKTNFEAGMQAKYGENASSVNAALNEGYASALANYKPPTATAPTSTAPTAGKSEVPKATSVGPQVPSKPAGKPPTASASIGAQPTSRPPRPRGPKPPKPPRPRAPRR